MAKGQKITQHAIQWSRIDIQTLFPTLKEDAPWHCHNTCLKSVIDMGEYFWVRKFYFFQQFSDWKSRQSAEHYAMIVFSYSNFIPNTGRRCGMTQQMDVKMTRCYTQQSERHEQQSKPHFCTCLSEQSLFCTILLNYMTSNMNSYLQDIINTTL